MTAIEIDRYGGINHHEYNFETSIQPSWIIDETPTYNCRQENSSYSNGMEYNRTFGYKPKIELIPSSWHTRTLEYLIGYCDSPRLDYIPAKFYTDISKISCPSCDASIEVYKPDSPQINNIRLSSGKVLKLTSLDTRPKIRCARCIKSPIVTYLGITVMNSYDEYIKIAAIGGRSFSNKLTCAFTTDMISEYYCGKSRPYIHIRQYSDCGIICAQL